MDSKLYYECHITIEPLSEELMPEVRQVAEQFGFKIARLLLQRREEDTLERSKYDTFMTAKGKNYEDLEARMYGCVQELQMFGYKVWRYKIEDTILDVRIKPKSLIELPVTEK